MDIRKGSERWVRQSKGIPPKHRVGRPRVIEDIETLVVRLAGETGLGYTRIFGKLRKLGVGRVSRSSIVNILRRHGFDPGPKRGEDSWLQYIEMHAETLWACDFASR